MKNIGKVVVMGASSGLGYALAERFIRDGWTVGVAARRQEPLQQLRQLAPDRVFTMPVDITADDAPSALNRLIEKMGGMDMYVHSSGIGHQNPDLDTDIEEKTLQTNACGFVRMIDAAFLYLRENGGGHIAAITSVAGIRPLGQSASYSATKIMQTAYMDGLEQISRRRNLGISFTDIKPGYVRTPLLSPNKKRIMLMDVDYAADRILKSLYRKKRMSIIDWRYHIIVTIGRLIPKCIWQRLPIVSK